MNRLAGKSWLFLLALILLCQAGSHTTNAAPAPADDGEVPFTTITDHYPGEAGVLSGAGSTFAAPVYKRWFDAYKAKIGVDINYDAVGSGEGVIRLINSKVDFAGSDAPLTDEQLRAAKGGQIVHIPTAFGALAIIYNVPGSNSPLRFTPQNIADIYLGEITRWNDAHLVANNPQLATVHQDIIVVHRADGSGSTYGLTEYLSSISPVWQRRSGKGTYVVWPVGIGGRGGDGMVNEVTANPYSIGYVDLGSATKNRLTFGLLKNSAGRFVAPSLESIGAAVAAAGQRGASDLRLSVVNAPGMASYPLCTGTWLVTYRNMTDKAKAVALTRMLWWAIHDAQTVNTSLDYAEVPVTLRTQSEQIIRQITVNGQPAFPGR